MNLAVSKLHSTFLMRKTNEHAFNKLETAFRDEENEQDGYCQPRHFKIFTQTNINAHNEALKQKEEAWKVIVTATCWILLLK